jgi:hypothetical protein
LRLECFYLTKWRTGRYGSGGEQDAVFVSVGVVGAVRVEMFADFDEDFVDAFVFLGAHFEVHQIVFVRIIEGGLRSLGMVLESGPRVGVGPPCCR